MARFARFPLVLALVCACNSTTTEQYPEDLSHPNYLKRNRAVRRFAVERDASRLAEGDAWPLLLDEHSSIRVLAHTTIRDISGRDFGYAPDLPLDVREGIAARWEAWWRATSREASGG